MRNIRKLKETRMERTILLRDLKFCWIQIRK